MYEHLGWHFPDFDRHFARTVSQYPVTDYQQATIDEAVRHVTAFECAVDVGGNIGLHTVRFAQLFGTVHSFEPTTTNFECLQKNTAILDNVILHQLGLGAESGTVTIQLPADANNCGNFSIVDFADNTEQTVDETIEIRTLDSFELAPNLIKIDVQSSHHH